MRKYRSKMTIYLEILGALMQQPRLPTNLAQIVSVNPARLDEYLTPLLAANLIKKDRIDDHEVIAILVEGRNAWEEIYKIEKKFNPAQTTTTAGEIWK